MTAAPLPPPPPPKQPSSREGWTAFLTAASIAIGIWAAIILLPELTSLLPLTLIAGSGIILGYVRKDVRSVNWGLAVASMGYFGIRVLYLRDVINDALFFDSFKSVVPITVLVTLACAWLGRRKLAPDGKTLTAFTKLGFYSLLIITPFIIGGLHDYNERADTSSPHWIILTIVDMWVDSDSDAWISVESSDGMSFSFSPTWDFYREHDIGDSMEVPVRKGALGYPWFVWERPAVSWLQENAVLVGIVIVGVIALVYYFNSNVKARKRAYSTIQDMEVIDKKFVSIIIKACLALLISAIVLLAIATGSLSIVLIILGISLIVLFIVKRRKHTQPPAPPTTLHNPAPQPSHKVKAHLIEIMKIFLCFFPFLLLILLDLLGIIAVQL